MQLTASRQGSEASGYSSYWIFTGIGNQVTRAKFREDPPESYLRVVVTECIEPVRARLLVLGCLAVVRALYGPNTCFTTKYIATSSHKENWQGLAKTGDDCHYRPPFIIQLSLAVGGSNTDVWLSLGALLFTAFFLVTTEF